jgi:hypothetical protein
MRLQCHSATLARGESGMVQVGQILRQAVSALSSLWPAKLIRCRGVLRMDGIGREIYGIYILSFLDGPGASDGSIG